MYSVIFFTHHIGPCMVIYLATYSRYTSICHPPTSCSRLICLGMDPHPCSPPLDLTPFHVLCTNLNLRHLLISFESLTFVQLSVFEVLRHAYTWPFDDFHEMVRVYVEGLGDVDDMCLTSHSTVSRPITSKRSM